MKPCAEYQQLLLEHLYGLLEDDQRRELEAHLAQCADCQSAYAQACQAREWLRQAACWSFEEVHFEPPPLAQLQPRQLEEARSQLSLAHWFAHQAPLWVLATSLLLAFGLVIWLASAFDQSSSQWALHYHDQLKLERKDGVGGFTRVGEASPEKQGESFASGEAVKPSKAMKSRRQNYVKNPSLQETICQDKPNNDGPLGSATQPAGGSKEPQARGQSLAREVGGPAGTVGLGRAGPGPVSASSAPAPPPGAATPESDGRDVALKPGLANDQDKAASEGQIGGERFLSALDVTKQFSVLRVGVKNAPEPLVQVEVIEFSVRLGSTQLRAKVASGARPEAGQLFAPEAPPKAGSGFGGPVGASVPKAEPDLALKLSAGHEADRAITLNNRRTQIPLELVERSQQVIARVPGEMALRDNDTAATETEIPIESGSLSSWISSVRIPVQPSGYLPAIALERLSRGDFLLHVIPVDSQRLQPAQVELAVQAWWTDDNQQNLGPVIALQRLGLATPALHSYVGLVPVYQAHLRLPPVTNKTRAYWLHVGDKEKRLTLIRLRWKQGDRFDIPSGSHKPGRSDSRPFPSFWRFSPDATHGPHPVLAGQAVEPEDHGLFDGLAEGLACCDHVQALELAHAGRFGKVPDPSLESLANQLRQYARRQQCKEWAENPGLGPPAGVSLTGQSRRDNASPEADHFSRLVLQMVVQPEYRERWPVVLGIGGLIALVGLTVACGIFGAVHGSACHLCWWRRLLVLVGVFATLWLAWAAIEGRTLLAPRTPGTFYPAGKTDSFLAHAHTQRSAVR